MVQLTDTSDNSKVCGLTQSVYFSLGPEKRFFLVNIRRQKYVDKSTYSGNSLSRAYFVDIAYY